MLSDEFHDGSLELVVQPDLFDGLLVIAKYSDTNVDVYSLGHSREMAGNCFLRYLDSRSGRWRRSRACYIDVYDPLLTITAEQSLTSCFSLAEQTVEYIKWLGVDEPFQAFAFFFLHPHWLYLDYPRAYVLLVWHFRDSLTVKDSRGYISRGLLSRLTCVELSKSQLKNIRKLSEHGKASEFFEATLNLVRQFNCLEELVLHRQSLDPAWVNSVADLFRRYSTFKYLAWKEKLLACESIERINGYIMPMIEVVADDIFICQGKDQVESFVHNKVTSLEKARLLFEAWARRSVAGDVGFFFSDYDKDAFFFPPVALLDDDNFNRIKTVMDMQKAALDLDNCAFDCVVSALQRDSAYFFYRNNQSRERAMLEIELPWNNPPAPGETLDAVQFLSVCNHPVSATAIANLVLWCDMQDCAMSVCIDTEFGNLHLTNIDIAFLARIFRHIRCDHNGDHQLLEENYQCSLIKHTGKNLDSPTCFSVY